MCIRGRRHSQALKNYVDMYERAAVGDAERCYKYLSQKTDKCINQRRQRYNQESVVAGREFTPSKHVGPGVVDPSQEAGAVDPNPNDKKDRKGKDKGRGKGKAKGGDAAGAKPGGGAGGADDAEPKVDAEGRPLRCMWHWFGCCKSHPLPAGGSCIIGEHVTVPRSDVKLRPAFKRMESLKGAWAPGKFRYEQAGDAAGAAVDDKKGQTPPASPRR